MTKKIDPVPDVPPELVKTMARYGFHAVTFVNRPISVLTVGAVVAWFRSGSDANRFATSLNKLYGCKDGYKGAPV